MGESDFSGPFIVGSGLRPSRRGPCKTPQGQPRDIPVPDQEASAHASVYDDAEPTYVSRSRHGPYCLLQDGKHRHSEVGFRRSMAGLRYPLSTLRFAPHGSPRMTRGRCGSLRLHRRGLSPHTSCRSPGAPVHIIKGGKRAIRWTRLSCRSFAANAVRLQLNALFLRTLATPEPIRDWSLTSLRGKLIKIGAKVVSGRYVAFQMAEVAIPRNLFADILRLIGAAASAVHVNGVIGSVVPRWVKNHGRFAS